MIKKQFWRLIMVDKSDMYFIQKMLIRRISDFCKIDVG